MRRMVGPIFLVVLAIVIWKVFSHGNPGGASDKTYAKYQRLAPPKVLYSCTRQRSSEWLAHQKKECARTGRAGCDEKVNESTQAQPFTTVDVAGGNETLAYDDVVEDLRRTCSAQYGGYESGKFAILESEKN